MENNNWELIFHPVAQKAYTILIIILIMWNIWYFISWESNIIVFIILLLFLVFLFLILILFPKKTYLKIQENILIIWGLDIPTFKTVEKCIQYENVESIAMLDGTADIAGRKNIYSVHIKERDQEKKTAIDWFSRESFNEIKNILIWKWLPVSVSTMKDTKRETEDFNKTS